MRRNDQGRNPGSGTPLIVRPRRRALPRWDNVVPGATELVIGHHDHRVPGAAAALDRLDQVDQVIAARADAGVAWMLVFKPDRLDEADRVQLAAVLRPAGELDERLLILQVRAPRLA